MLASAASKQTTLTWSRIPRSRTTETACGVLYAQIPTSMSHSGYWVERVFDVFFAPEEGRRRRLGEPIPQTSPPAPSTKPSIRATAFAALILPTNCTNVAPSGESALAALPSSWPPTKLSVPK